MNHVFSINGEQYVSFVAGPELKDAGVNNIGRREANAIACRVPLRVAHETTE